MRIHHACCMPANIHSCVLCPSINRPVQAVTSTAPTSFDIHSMPDPTPTTSIDETPMAEVTPPSELPAHLRDALHDARTIRSCSVKRLVAGILFSSFAKKKRHRGGRASSRIIRCDDSPVSFGSATNQLPSLSPRTRAHLLNAIVYRDTKVCVVMREELPNHRTHH